MRGLDIVRMVISPGSSHSFWVPVVRDDVTVIREFLLTYCTFTALLGDLPIEQLPHLSWRSKFPISPGVMRVVYALNT